MLSSQIRHQLIRFYRYPFKLVVRPRKILSNTKYPKNRYSPAGFNNNRQNKNVQYDLYIEPDSIQKLSNTIGYLVTLALLGISIFFIANRTDLCNLDKAKILIIPIASFYLPYFLISSLINSYYYSYPLFHHVWSEKVDCYQEWFAKVPQEIEIHPDDKENHLIHQFMQKKYIKQHQKNHSVFYISQPKSRQALYYAWNSGSPQKSMWLLAIENIIAEWENQGFFKNQTSLFVILYPIFLSYLALLLTIIILDTLLSGLVKNMYIPLLAWLFLSITYLLMIYMFISERKKNETQANKNIKKFIPYEFRSSISRYNNLYKKFQDAHFITVNNLLFAGLFVFYISLIALIK